MHRSSGSNVPPDCPAQPRSQQDLLQVWCTLCLSPQIHPQGLLMSRTQPGTPTHKGGTVPLGSQGQVSRKEQTKNRKVNYLQIFSQHGAIPGWVISWERGCVFCSWLNFAFKKLLSGSRWAFSSPKAHRDELHETPSGKIYQLLCVLESANHGTSLGSDQWREMSIPFHPSPQKALMIYRAELGWTQPWAPLDSPGQGVELDEL